MPKQCTGRRPAKLISLKTSRIPTSRDKQRTKLFVSNDGKNTTKVIYLCLDIYDFHRSSVLALLVGDHHLWLYYKLPQRFRRGKWRPNVGRKNPIRVRLQPVLAWSARKYSELDHSPTQVCHYLFSLTDFKFANF